MMAAGGEVVPENLKTQLAIAIRSIRWSYAIFWSISKSDEGVLEWREGYYNGDIKTRKTIQTSEFDSDQLGLLRSEQLRELYGSLSEDCESSLQVKRPTAALSPEDLTDTEWYYLVCMSFMFDIGQGLPGRTFANGQYIWLSDAPFADSKLFNRCLLAKSASIQTVVCFPYLGGVIEMGVTESVEEDHGFIEHVKTSYLTNPSVSFSMIPTSFSGNGGRIDDENDQVFDDLFDTDLNLTDEWDPIMGDSFLADHDLHEEFNNCIMQNAASSSDCISHTLLNTCGWSSPGKRKANDECSIDEIEQREFTRKRSSSCSMLDVQTEDDSHYGVVVASLLKSSNRFLLDTCLRKLENQESSFVGWRKNSHFQPRKGEPQRLLKKILMDVPRMNQDHHRIDSRKKEGHHDVVDSNNHTLSERRRRERLSDRLSVLGSLIPSIKKVDKVSILDNTIEYVIELEKRVAELESSSEAEFGELKAKTIAKRKNVIATDEGISNNIENYIYKNKRKSTILEKSGLDGNNSTDKVKVIVDENDALIIEIRCLWRESLLLDIMDAMGRLCLDSHSVQSNNVDGFLSITIKSKIKGSASGLAAMITEAVQKVVWKN